MLNKAKVVVCSLMLFCLPTISNAVSVEDLAKAAQNLLAAMISLPLQLNTNFDTGPQKKPLYVLNIQPVVPISLTQNWNLITRTIIPFISDPGVTNAQARINGVGDMQMSLFLSPTQPLSSGWIVGAGAVGQAQTRTNDRLKAGGWGVGPTAVALRSTKKWTYGALVNNVWSDGNNFLVQPFVNYNLPNTQGTYLVSAPVMTANWKASSHQQWTLPIGLGVGKILTISGQAMNAQVSAYYNIERPRNVSPWMIRVQIQFLFPK